MRGLLLIAAMSFVPCLPGCHVEKDSGVDFVDADGDGSTSDVDCDDTNPEVNPDADETCDGLDNNCDGETDEGVLATFFADSDGDGHGDPGATQQACTAPAGHTTDATDCDDANPDAFPGADEVCNGVDDDCDDAIDDDPIDSATWYADDDEDGWGDDSDTVEACDPPQNHVATGGDCNDGDSAVNPGATEICNGIDDDCGGDIDTDAIAPGTWYLDSDSDGYGDPEEPLEACTLPKGYTDNANDCEDGDADVHPGATEICNEVDDDCDQGVDEDAIDIVTWYPDSDGDGFGVASKPVDLCFNPGSHTEVAGDCDDSSSSVNPGVSEACGDGVDNDCDGSVDEGCAIDVCGDISSDETWGAGSIHHVTCDIMVQGSSSPVLTIEDGAVVTFANGTNLYVGWNGTGGLDVQGGTTGVLFTSDQSNPSPGAWGGLNIGPNDIGSTLEGITIEYAGGNGYGGIRAYYGSPAVHGSELRSNANAGIAIEGNAWPIITDTFITDNTGDGVHAPASGLEISSGASFQGNTVSGNGGVPIDIRASYVSAIDASSTLSGNASDHVRVEADTMGADATWQAIDVPYYLVGDVMVHGAASPVLFMDDGVEILGGSGANLYIGWNGLGALMVDGSSLGVTFSGATSVPGGWGGISIGPNDTGSMLVGATVLHGGANGYGCIRAYYGSPEIEASTIGSCANNGYHGTQSSPAIFDSTFEDNAQDGIYLDSGSSLDPSAGPVFSGNNLTGNGASAISLPPNSIRGLEPGNSFAGNNLDYIRVHAGNVGSDAEWYDHGVPYYISGDVMIEGSWSPMVIIEDAVEMAFAQSANLYVGWSGVAALLIDGSTVGVTMRGSSATPGYWGGLSLGPNLDAGSQIIGLTLRDGGGNGYGGIRTYYAPFVDIAASTLAANDANGIYVENSILEMTNTTVSENTGNGIYISNNSSLAWSSSGPTFTGNAFSGNTSRPMWLPPNSVGMLDASSTFSGNGNDVIAIHGNNVTTSATWQALDVPYEVNGDIMIGGSTSPIVEIEEGTEIRFSSSTNLYVGWNSIGGIQALGTTASPIVFTSASSTPSNGSWGGISVGPNCIAASSHFDHVVVEYGGANGYGNFRFYYCGGGSVTDSMVANSSTWGIYRENSTPSLSGIQYAGNTSGDLH